MGVASCLFVLRGNFVQPLAFWSERFVRCPEYRGCPYLRGLKYTIYMDIAVGATACVHYLEVVRFSEGPLIEALLYVCILRQFLVKVISRCTNTHFSS